jgi:hypothetical protein
MQNKTFGINHFDFETKNPAQLLEQGKKMSFS